MREKLIDGLQWLLPVAVALISAQLFLGGGSLFPLAISFPIFAAWPAIANIGFSSAVVVAAGVSWRWLLSQFVASSWVSSFLAALSLATVPAVRSSLLNDPLSLIAAAILLFSWRRRDLLGAILIGLAAGFWGWPIFLVLPLFWSRQILKPVLILVVAPLTASILTPNWWSSWSLTSAGATVLAAILASMVLVVALGRNQRDLGFVLFAFTASAPSAWIHHDLIWAPIAALAVWTIAGLNPTIRFTIGAAGLWWAYDFNSLLSAQFWAPRHWAVGLLAPIILLLAVGIYLLSDRVADFKIINRFIKTQTWARTSLAVAFPALFIVLLTLAETTGASLRLHQFGLVDFEVYHRAGVRILNDISIYQDEQLPWVYGPFAAITMVPFGVLPLWAAAILWTAINVGLIFTVVRHFGFTRWQTSLLTTTTIFTLPVHQSFFTGQIGVVLLSLIFLDFARNHRTSGFWLGVAAMIKLTPGAIVAALGAAGRVRLVFWSGIGFLVTSGLAFIFRPRDSIDFWARLSSGGLRGLSDYHRAGNQTIYGALQRFGVESPSIGIGVSAAVFIAGAVSVAIVYRRGYQVLALCLAAFLSLSVAPVSWSHAYVWVIPFGLLLFEADAMPVWTRRCAAVVVLWFCWGPYLAIKKGGGQELHYPISLKLISGAGPLLILVLVVITAIECWPGKLNAGDKPRSDSRRTGSLFQ